MFKFATIVALIALASAAPSPGSEVCPGATKISETFIGKDANVKAEVLSCPGATPQALAARQVVPPTNVCGATCSTNCFGGSTGGPNNSDCHVIADALLFESENGGALFAVGNGTGNNTVALTFRSCQTFFVNQDLGPVTYCRSAWAALTDILTNSCGGAQNAHGGNCVAADQRWFIQLQHS